MLIGLFQGTEVCLIPPVKVCMAAACLPLEPRVETLGAGVCDVGAKVVVEVLLLLLPLLPMTIFFVTFLLLNLLSPLLVMLPGLLLDFSTMLLTVLPLELLKLLLLLRT